MLVLVHIWLFPALPRIDFAVAWFHLVLILQPEMII